MIDFWFSLIITAIITVTTILLDRLTSKLVVQTRTINSFERLLVKGAALEDAQVQIKATLNKYKTSSLASKVWGAEIAAVAIAIDFTVLGIYISHKAYFPFFLKFDDPSTSRDSMVWIIVIVSHLALILVSMLMKHSHVASMDSVEDVELERRLGIKWFVKQKWAFASNSCGFVTLLSAVSIVRNAF